MSTSSAFHLVYPIHVKNLEVCEITCDQSNKKDALGALSKHNFVVVKKYFFHPSNKIFILGIRMFRSSSLR